MFYRIFLAIGALQARAFAQNCPSFTADYPAPSVADGYEARLIATGLTVPRGIIFDNKGNLLVVERGVGVTSFAVEGSASCVNLKDKKTVVSDDTLNHGIEITDDGKTLYASSSESVLKYAYDSGSRKVNGNGEILISGMHTDGTVTRSLLLSRKSQDKLLVSRGSDENIDLSTVDVNAGQSQVRIFDTKKVGQDYASGTTLAWGLRNAVGIAENPADGGIWSAENNADNIERDGFRIHENNPAEELNYHGKLADEANNPHMNKNYGYPLCYGVWDVEDLPSPGNLEIGQQFAIAENNATSQDGFCNSEREAPRLVFQPHTSPLDLKFDGEGENLYVSLHGSWNTEDPVGYSVSHIRFDPNTHQPVDQPTSTTALTPILHNSNTTACPGECFRPAGLAWDRNGRLYMSSDTTGEIYVIVKAGGGPLDEARPAAGAAERIAAKGLWAGLVTAVVVVGML